MLRLHFYNQLQQKDTFKKKLKTRFKKAKKYPEKCMSLQCKSSHLVIKKQKTRE